MSKRAPNTFNSDDIPAPSVGLSNVELPDGFEEVVSGTTWDFRETPTLQGTIQAFTQHMSRKFRDEETGRAKIQRRCALVDKNGVLWWVWESAGLGALYDLKEGAEVFIAYRGDMPVEGRDKLMHMFTIAKRAARSFR